MVKVEVGGSSTVAEEKETFLGGNSDVVTPVAVAEGPVFCLSRLAPLQISFIAVTATALTLTLTFSLCLTRI